MEFAKKAKYLSDYDDALLVQPQPVVKRASEDILPLEGCKKVKTGSSDQDGPLSISWAELPLRDNVGISQYSNIETQVTAEDMLGNHAFNQVRSLGGLEEWLAGFESCQNTRNHLALHDLMNVQANTNPTSKMNQTRQRMQHWVERVERLVEIRKLTMNITADDEWMLKRNLDRSLMELDRIMSLSGTPTVIWNTSGEILKVGDEFCMLTEWRREDLIGRHIEEIFEPESLEEYLDLVECSVFPDHNCNSNRLHPSPNSQGQALLQRSSSTSSSSLSLPDSPSLPSSQLVTTLHAPHSTFDYSYSCERSLDDLAGCSPNTSRDKKGREFTQTIKFCAIRKSCTPESIGCSFCFRVTKDLFDCPSTIIANFLPILTRTSYSNNSS